MLEPGVALLSPSALIHFRVDPAGMSYSVIELLIKMQSNPFGILIHDTLRNWHHSSSYYTEKVL